MRTLKEIIEHKKEEVKKEKSRLSRSEIKDLISNLEKPRNFSDKLSKKNNDFGIIAEIKKASPSKGIIRKNFDPVKIAIEYKTCDVDCLSILTDKFFFHGDNKYIQKVKEVVELPVLRKDFIIDNWQISQSRALSADCILLILSCLF